MRTTIEKADIPAYMANVMRIASAGGKIEKKESFVLQAISDRLGATESDMNAARRLLLRGHDNIYLPKTTNARMDNLQDMVMMALADGVITPMESEPIEKIAKVMKYSQADIDLALRRAGTELTKITRRHSASSIRSASKPKRSHHTDRYEIPEPDSRTNRHDRQESAKKAKVTMPPPPLPKAAATPPKPPPLKKPEPKPEPPKQAKPQHPEKNAPAENTAPAQPEPAKELPPQPAPYSRTLTDCIKCRNESEHPETYCFGLPAGPLNPWGCRFSNMPWTPAANWLKRGHYSDDATFLFDKRSIAEQLSANLAGVLDCPHLNTEYTEKAFDSLPKRVTIGERWDYNEADSGNQDAVTIKTVGYIHGCQVTKTINVDGIIPIGTRDALKIVRKASRKINNPDIYKSLKKQLT